MHTPKKTRQELMREVERLRRENQRLRDRLRRPDPPSRKASREHAASEEMTAPHRLISQALQRHRLFASDSYAGYLWHSVRETGYYQRVRDFWIRFRRYRLISRCVTVAAALFTVMGTSAVVVLGTLVCLLLIPAAALIAGGTTLLGYFRRHKQNERLRTEIEGRTVYLFFPSALRKPSFTISMIRDLSRRPDCTVFVVSPYLWSAKGLDGEGFYINARQEDAHLFLLRRHYFFFFRRLLDGRTDQRTVAIF